MLLKTFSFMSITSSISICVALGISQLLGRQSKQRLIAASILILVAYLNYHLYLLITKKISALHHHFLWFIPALLFLGSLITIFFRNIKNHQGDILTLQNATLLLPALLSTALPLHYRIMDQQNVVTTINSLYQNQDRLASFVCFTSLLSVLSFIIAL